MNQFTEGLSEKVKAKRLRDLEKAKADPATQMLVDNLNRNVRREAQERGAARRKAEQAPKN